jgi:hypothetical protein
MKCLSNHAWRNQNQKPKQLLYHDCSLFLGQVEIREANISINCVVSRSEQTNHGEVDRTRADQRKKLRWWGDRCSCNHSFLPFGRWALFADDLILQIARESGITGTAGGRCGVTRFVYLIKAV